MKLYLNNMVQLLPKNRLFYRYLFSYFLLELINYLNIKTKIK